MGNEWEKLGYTGREWFQLPINIRRQWWIETDYGKKPPSENLVKAIQGQVAIMSPKAK